jgi:serine/threonine protein kinase/WD40 repeat protein
MPPSNPSRSADTDPLLPDDQSKHAISSDEPSTLDNAPNAGATAKHSTRINTLDGPSPVPLAEPVEQPTQLGGYRIQKLLGEGGMGAVYAAVDIALRRPVAIKTMRPELASNESARSRFSREAQAAAAVENDHIVRIYFVGEDRGVPFIAMEYLRGKPLNEWMRKHLPASPQQILKIGYETALGLAAAHSRGLVHRDIKPANIWLEAPQGRVKILDFGLARSAERDVHLTGTGVVVGTPAYMALEQARGLAVDHRTDLFSLGCVLYHLATGHRPFTGSNTLAVLTSLALDTPVAPCEVNSAVPKPLSDLILRLIAKLPEDRPQTAAEVAEQLRRIFKGEKGETGTRLKTDSAPVPAQPVLMPVSTQVGETLWENIAVSGTNEHETATEAPRPAAKPAWTPIYAVTAVAALMAVIVGIILVRALTPAKPPERTAEATEPPTNPSPQRPPRPNPSPPSPTPGPNVVPPRPIPRKVPPEELIPAMTPMKPASVITLDHLDPKDIPAEERFEWQNWQDTKLVAVIGSHRRRLWGSAGPLILSPDGKRVVAGNRLLIDLETLKETWLPHDCIGFLPDGKHVFISDTIWELDQPTKEPVKSLANLSGAQFLTDRIVLGWDNGNAVAWKLGEGQLNVLKNLGKARGFLASTNGKLFAVAPESQEEYIKLYELTGDSIADRGTLSGPEGKATCKLASFANDRLAVHAPEGPVHVWDVNQPGRKLVASPTAVTAEFACCLTGSGSRIVIGHQSGFQIWEINGEKPKMVTSVSFSALGEMNLSSMAMTPDGRTILTGHLGGAIQVWSVEQDVIVARDRLEPQSTGGGQVEISPDGRTLATTSESGKIELRDLATPGLDRLPVPDDFSGTISPFSPDGRILPLIGGGASQGVSLWQIGAGREMPKRLQRLGNDSSVGWSPDGKWLAAVEQGGDLVVWDLARTSEGPRYRIPLANAKSIRFAPSGQHLIVHDNAQTLTVYAVTNKELIVQDRILDNLDQGDYSTISSDGKTVARSGWNHLIFLNFIAGKLDTKFMLPFSIGYAHLDFSPDSKAVAVPRGDQVQLLDVADGKIMRPISYVGRVTGVRYHPDGRHLFVTGVNHVIYVLRLAPPPPLKRTQ